MFPSDRLSEDDIHYALENTSILIEPDRRIDTFGSTQFEFILISGLMDDVTRVSVRTGRIEAERPSILKPDASQALDFDGFGEQAEAFADFIRSRLSRAALLQYGFTFKRTEVTESIVTDSVEAVTDRVCTEAKRVGNPMTAVLLGVHDTWEICLLKFTLDMIQKSAKINVFDFKRRGLLD